MVGKVGEWAAPVLDGGSSIVHRFVGRGKFRGGGNDALDVMASDVCR